MNLKNQLIVFVLALAPVPALAYLDPGTGSMLLQVILGGVAAVGVAVKLFWYRIIRFLGFGKNAENENKVD